MVDRRAGVGFSDPLPSLARGTFTPPRDLLMHRLLTGLCVLGLVGALAWADDAKPTEATTAFKALEKEFLGKIQTEKDQKARGELLKTYSKKFYELAEKNPKDGSSCDALIYVLRMTQPSKDKDDVGTKALAAIKQDHLKGKSIGRWLGVLAGRGDEGPEMIQVVIADHPDKKVQVKAVRMMKQLRESMVQAAEKVKDDETLKERIEKARGADFVKNLLANADKYAKDVKDYDKLLTEKYAGVFPEIKAGKPAPEVECEDLEGKKVKLSDLKGKVVVLDVWATWCGPCVSMIPHSTKLVEKMKNKPFVFVGASADEKKETVRDFLKKKEMPWTHWWIGPSEGLVEDWQIEGFPTIYLIDAKGVIREVLVGANHSAKIDEVAEKLVKEAEDAKKDKAP